MSDSKSGSKSVSELKKRALDYFDNGEFEQSIKSWEDVLSIEHDDSVVLKLAAVSWHQCLDGPRALEYLALLSEKGKNGHRCQWFLKSMASELQVFIEKYSRLSMKEPAFTLFTLLRRDEFSSNISSAVVHDIYSRELISPVVQLIRSRLRVLREKLFRLAEKDSALGKMLKSARGRMEDSSQSPDDEDAPEEPTDTTLFEDDCDDGNFDEDDYDYEDAAPDDETLSRLPRLEKEVQILQWIEGRILEKELEWAYRSSPQEYMKLFNDTAILGRLEELLLETEPVLDKFADYSIHSVSEIKDFLGSFLPGSIRDRVCNNEYLDVVRMESHLERKLLLFIRVAYDK